MDTGGGKGHRRAFLTSKKKESDKNRKRQLFLKSFDEDNNNLDGLFLLIFEHRQKGEYQKGFQLGMKYISKYGYKNILIFKKNLPRCWVN